MISYRDTALALYGSYRLLRLDPGGMSFFDRSRQGFWLSFYGPALVWPVYMAVELLTRDPFSDPMAGHMATGDFIILRGSTYILAVLVFALVMAYLARALHKQDNYVQFIVIYNWASVIQAAIFFPAVSLGWLLFPENDLSRLVETVLLLVCIGYAWYVIRTSLTDNGWLALVVLVIEVMLHASVEAIVLSLY